MPTWLIVLISVVTPALVTAGLPYLSARLNARRSEQLTDAQVGMKLRNELRDEIERLQKLITACDEDREELRTLIGQLRYDLTTLQEMVRQGTSGQMRRDILDEAAG